MLGRFELSGLINGLAAQGNVEAVEFGNFASRFSQLLSDVVHRHSLGPLIVSQ
ncbi:hypothetical protein D9M71_810340 [compost metagenome]